MGEEVVVVVREGVVGWIVAGPGWDVDVVDEVRT